MELTIVLGYLGSGKTTFLQHYLTANAGLDTAVIVNDFGAEDVDGKLLAGYAKTVSSISDGSIFCTCRSDQFVSALLKLSERNPAPQKVLVETSGLANPYTMLQVMDTVRKKAACEVTLDCVVCLVDATAFEKTLTCVHMAKMQVACADVILINKTDLVSEADVKRILSLVSELNPTAKTEITVNSVMTEWNGTHADRALPANYLDLCVQKCTVDICGEVTFRQLDEMCAELSAVAHRVKGAVHAEGKSGVYQYCNGKSSFTEGEGGSYLVVLTCGAHSLKKELNSVLRNYHFAKLREM